MLYKALKGSYFEIIWMNNGKERKMYGANDEKGLTVNICVHLGGRNIEVVDNLSTKCSVTFP